MKKTMQMMSGLAAILGLVSAFGLTGCASGDAADEDEAVGDVQQAQVDPNVKVWSRVTMAFADPASTPFATIYVFNRALGAYQTGTEYWFVNLNSTSLLGRYALNMVQTDQTTTTAPSDPAYASEQAFSLPEFVSWGTGWTTDPGSGGSLYSGPSQHSLRLTAGSTGLTNVRWYQVIASTATPHNLTVNGSFTLGASSVSVPSGYLGYSIAQTP